MKSQTVDLWIERQFRDLPPAVRRWGRKGLGILEKGGHRFFRPRTLLHIRVVSRAILRGAPAVLASLPAPVGRWLEGELGRSLRGLCVVRAVSYNPTKRERERRRRTLARLGTKVDRNLKKQGVTAEEWERLVAEAVTEVRARRARTRNAALVRWRRARARR